MNEELNRKAFDEAIELDDVTWTAPGASVSYARIEFDRAGNILSYEPLPQEDDDTMSGPFSCRGVAFGCLFSAVLWLTAALICRALLR